MGAQRAWQLVCRGATVVGYETYAPGHARGAAGGENRLFRTLELEDPRYSPIVARADELWSELEYVSGRELRTTTGSLLDRKSTRLNSSHVAISYAVFCLKKKRTQERM